ncbi:CocE/NonD family hydrolase [Actinoplanes sp. NPDC048988]|uniref:CocE/NonD family hydrolase n=1 Tax=Actinoplanes sp. NPDC048988 TaxID=3363901 RepID=UPI00372000A4
MSSPASAVPAGPGRPAADDEPIVEDVWVEAPLDSDNDHRPDRVHLNIIRPVETDRAGQKVASIIDASPYYGGFLDVPYHNVDVGSLPQQSSASGTERRRHDDRVSIRSHLVARSYASIIMDSLGTAGSTGCPDAGGKDETAATMAVIDWLDGKGRAYDAAGKIVRATWSARSVAMWGASYDGTLPIAAAVTGRSALKAIIPMSAVTSWYDYYRANGLVVAPGNYQGEDLDIMARAVLTREHPEACAAAMDRLEAEQDRVSGDYSPVWAERDYAARAGQIKAAVLVVQGLRDWNVKTQQGIRFWEALGRAGVDRKLWLYDGGHGVARSSDFWETVDRWHEHYLYGVDNGVDREPPVTFEDANATVTERATSWPVPGSKPVTVPLATGPNRVDTFTDNGRTVTAEALIADPSAAHRLIYRRPPLTKPARLSGTPYVTLTASIDNRTAANLTALLVDFGPGGSAPVVVSRGWMDPRNRISAQISQPVVAGQRYRLRWNLQPKDYVFQAGHQIGLVVISTDHDYTLRPLPGTRISVVPTASRVELPLVGGRSAL